MQLTFFITDSNKLKIKDKKSDPKVAESVDIGALWPRRARLLHVI